MEFSVNCLFMIIDNNSNSRRNGKGMVTDTSKRTITVTFENGNTVKNTYIHNDTYFYGIDF